MPRKSTTFVPDTTGPQMLSLDQIPQDVKDFVEDVYKKQRNAMGRERVEYDTPEELAVEFKQMTAYCAQRPAGILKIRRSPTRGLPENVMDIRITADIEANGNAKGSKK